MILKRSLLVGFFLVLGGVFLIPLAHAQLTPQERIQKEAELKQVEAEAAQAQKQLVDAQSQSASISRDIAVLTARIKAAALDIKAKNLLIQTLGTDIANKQTHIEELEARIAKGKQTLADLLRKTNEVDDKSLPQIILSESSVSGFFKDIDDFQSVQSGLGNLFEQLRSDQEETAVEKEALDQRRAKEVDARYTIQQQQKNIQTDEAQKKQLLTISKGNEKSYNTLLSQKQAKAAQIRAELFSLSGAQAIPFGDAYNYATQVFQKTGVPQNLLLAILTQETNLGKNVGTCYLTNTSDGSGINTRTNALVANVMKPTRDVQPFIAITSGLGLDYRTTVVSCPQSIGYGGGMGPAQFIASTWTLIEDRIEQAIGGGKANPWKPFDAFTASGIYLMDLGANSTSYSSQRNAACRYYSGRACGAVTGSNSYGNSVMALADRIQRNQINPLLGL